MIFNSLYYNYINISDMYLPERDMDKIQNPLFQKFIHAPFALLLNNSLEFMSQMKNFPYLLM